MKKRTPYSAMVITYPSGAKQTVKPNMDYFGGDWNDLAIAIAGNYYRDASGNVMRIPFELR
jgi:hypothetical protein